MNNLYKKIVSSMGPLLNIVQSKNKPTENNPLTAGNLAALLFGCIIGFTLCMILILQNIIIITKDPLNQGQNSISFASHLQTKTS